MRLFMRLLLIDSLFGCALAAGALALHQTVPVAALVAITAVLALFAAGAAACAYMAWTGTGRWLDDVDWLSERLPGVAMLGTVAGFMAQRHDDSRLTVLISTFVGIACWQALGLQHRLVSREADR